MGNCCTEGQQNQEHTSLLKQQQKFTTSDNIQEERFYQSLDYSDVQSDFSEQCDPNLIMQHGPSSDTAVKISHIPEDLKQLIDERLGSVPTFIFDDDADYLNSGIEDPEFQQYSNGPILLGPRQLPCHTIYIGQ